MLSCSPVSVRQADVGSSLPPGQSRVVADLQLLRLLAEDARLSQRALARALHMSPPAVGERIARLERTGVIRGYRADVDWAALGWSLVVYLGVVAVQGQDQRQLVDGLRALPPVESVDVVTGPFDLLVRVRVRDHSHLRDTLFDQIWAMPGVNRTETYVSLDTMAPKNFGADYITALLGEAAAGAYEEADRDH